MQGNLSNHQPEATVMLVSIYKKYLIFFTIIFIGYTFLDIYVSLHFNLPINEKYLTFWIPFIMIWILAFFIFRPVLRRLKYKEKARTALLWYLIPFTTWIPVAASQGYFKDINYTIVEVEKPKDLFKFPNERFFKIKDFAVDTSKHFLIKERHTSGKYGTTLNLNNYFIIPMFDDSMEKENEDISRIGYGAKFSTSMSNSFLYKKEQPEKIRRFYITSREGYNNYDFYHVDYFEKLRNSDDAKYFLEAVDNNPSFNHSVTDLVLVKRSGSLKELYNKGRNMFVYSTLISLTLGLGCLFLVNRSQMKAQQSMDNNPTIS